MNSSRKYLFCYAVLVVCAAVSFMLAGDVSRLVQTGDNIIYGLVSLWGLDVISRLIAQKRVVTFPFGTSRPKGILPLTIVIWTLAPIVMGSYSMIHIYTFLLSG